MLTMARSRLCRCCTEFHDLAQPWPEACGAHFGAVSASGPHIVSDNIEPFRSHADGQIYSSKSLYRQDLKARGLIEVGNEQVQSAPTRLPPVRQHLRQSLEQLRG